jgi:hypothetical protein
LALTATLAVLLVTAMVGLAASAAQLPSPIPSAYRFPPGR